MALYFEPPTGYISWQKLEAFALKRLAFLIKILAAQGNMTKLNELVCDEETVTNSDCLIAGSTKDKVSHFILRLLMGGDPETSLFFCQAETALFDFHFSYMSEEEMQRFFKKIDKSLRSKSELGWNQLIRSHAFKQQEIDSILMVFNNIRLSVGSWRKVIELYLAQCNTQHFLLPFQSVLDLLPRRQIRLERGVAKVPFSKLREVVKEQFLSLMHMASRQVTWQFQAALADDRLKNLWTKLKHTYRKQYSGSVHGADVPRLSLDQVDTLSTNFPLCMTTLLQSLRQNHRLNHHARIQLTLFLKDLGLPVHHAIALWQQEYSQPSASGSLCSHSWQQDGRRYTYSIRHLYGLEGARHNYLGHSCESLQKRILGCGEHGGCPFSHWDDDTLSAELDRLALASFDISDVLSLRGAGQLSAACRRFLSSTSPNETHATESSPGIHSGLKSDLTVELQSLQELKITPSYEGNCTADSQMTLNKERKICTGVKCLRATVTDVKRMWISESEGMCLSNIEGEQPVTFCEKKRNLKRKHLIVNECESFKSPFSYIHLKRSLVPKISSLSALGPQDAECSHICGSTFLSPHTSVPVKHSNSYTDSKVHISVKTVDTLVHRSLRESKHAQAVDMFEPATLAGQIWKSDHARNQSVSSNKQSQSANIQCSVAVRRPIHYFQLSYQQLLQNLKLL